MYLAQINANGREHLIKLPDGMRIEKYAGNSRLFALFKEDHYLFGPFTLDDSEYVSTIAQAVAAGYLRGYRDGYIDCKKQYIMLSDRLQTTLETDEQ